MEINTVRTLTTLTALALAMGLTTAAYADQNGRDSSNLALGLYGPAAAEDSLATVNKDSHNFQTTAINSSDARQTFFDVYVGDITLKTALANSDLDGVVIGAGGGNGFGLGFSHTPMSNRIVGSNDPVGISQISQNAGHYQLTQQSVVVQASSVAAD
jgi:hypothetical protein